MKLLLIPLLLCAFPWPALGIGTFVRTTQTPATGSNATTIVSASQNHATGNLLVVFVAWSDASNVINASGITDTAGNTYTPGTRLNSSTTSSQMWYARNIAGNASNVVTVTFSAICSYRSLIVHEYSGLQIAAPLDVEAAPYGVTGSSSASSNAFTTTNANDMLVLFATGTPTFAAGAGYTIRDSSIDYAGGEDRHVSSIQTAATGAMTAPPGNFNVHVMAFKDVSVACNIATGLLPGGAVGTAYSQTVATNNCPAPTFSVSAGALPGGLSLNTSSGLISGTPATTTGSPFAFTIAVAGANGNAAQALSMAIAAAPVCAIAAATLPGGTVGIAYSQTVVATNCASPTFSVSVGALPTGLSIDSGTGLISGTPSTIAGSPFGFTIAISDASGNPSQAYNVAIIISAIILSGPTCVGNSPSSAKCTWTTDIASSSQIQCGIVTGGPYTSYQTTEVYTQAGGPGAGVTVHSMVIPGLPNNVSSTAYFCRVLSRQFGGAFVTSAETTTGTLAAMTSTPFTAILSPVTRYNDQFNGDRGMPNRGIAANMDTYYPTMWADDGKLYGAANDTYWLATGHGAYAGTGGGGGSNIAIYSTSPADGTPAAAVQSLLTMSLVNKLTNFGTATLHNSCSNGTISGSGCWTDDGTWKSGNGISFNHNLVQHVVRQSGTGGLWANSSLIVSSDHGATWLAPANYPAGTPQANGDPPSGPSTAMWTGGFANKCANAAIPQHGQDYGFTNPANFVNYGNADAFVYLLCTKGDYNALDRYLARVRVEDFLLLDVTKYRYYTGGDGLLDVNWSSDIAAAIATGILTTGHAGPCAVRQGVEFIPDFNRWMFTCSEGPNTTAATVLIFDASYPWGPAYTLVGGLPRVQSNLNYVPGFTIPLASTYSKISTNPLVSTIAIMTCGEYFGQFSNNPGNDEYSPHWFTARLVPQEPTGRGPLHRPYVSRNGRNMHLAAGLELFYDFQGGSGLSGTGLIGAKGSTFSYTVPDLSPNGKYSIALPASAPALFDQYGMLNFGFWSGSVANCSPACDAPINYTLSAPYNAAMNDFTMAVVFSHYPSSLAISSGELVLDKTDLQLLRNGNTANSWGIATNGLVAVTNAACAGNVVTLTTNANTFTGGPIAISGMNPSGYNDIVMPTQVTSTSVSYNTGSCPGAFVGGGTVANAIGPFALATDGGFAALLIRRIGSAVTIYQSSGIGSSQPLTALAAGTVTGPLGANSLNIGSTLRGIMSELLIYNRGLADDELLHEMAVIRRNMSDRGISLP